MNQVSYDALIALSPSAKEERASWLKHTLNVNGSPLHLPPPDMITTDASKKAGVQKDGHKKSLSNTSII